MPLLPPPDGGGRALRRVALAGALLLAVCGCSGPPADQVPVPRVEESVLDGQSVVAVWPGEQAPRGLVLYLHGLGQTSSALVDEPDVRRVVEPLVEAGYVVAATDAEGDAFGSPAAQADYLALIQAVRAETPVDDVLFFAVSMGGLSALPLAASGQVEGLRGVVGVSPAVTFDSTSFEAYRSAIQEAWGRLPTAAEDPLALPPERFAGLAFRFYVADDDDLVPTPQNADRFADLLSGVTPVDLVGCTGGHVASSCFQPDDVLEWAEAHTQ